MNGRDVFIKSVSNRRALVESNNRRVQEFGRAPVDADLELRRMDTGSEPTCEDGTVDHVLVAARRSRGGVAYRAVKSETLVDARAEFSDHAMVKCELALTS